MVPGATGPLTVHRLDMETSGVMVYALDPDAHRELSGQFERRETEKRYIALLTGHLPETASAIDDPTTWPTIDFPMRLDPDNRPIQVYDPELGRAALTRYRVLGHESVKGAPATRIEFAPVTGRSHQLRLHSAHERGLHAPILGDPLYGDPKSAPRLMLHATLLSLRDSNTGDRLSFRSAAPF
jgi:tRNA pseudouridine32 synthase/23S rRNA pseudouridine746 synthase